VESLRSINYIGQNSLNPNSKFQTRNTSKVLLSGIITGRPGFVKRFDATVVPVLVIEY
jgi:hypothetical protein